MNDSFFVKAATVAAMVIFSIALCFFIKPFVSNVRASGGLVADWTFNEGTGTTLGDTSGNNNTMTIYGTPTWTTSPVGGALSFNGSSDYAYRSSISTPPASTMTLCSWFETSSNTTQDILGFGRNPASFSNEGIFFITASGNLSFWDYGSGYGFPLNNQGSTRNVNDGHWHLGCFVKNGTAGTYYVDGVASGTVTAAIDVSYSNADWTIGKDYRDNDNYFNGLMGETTVYNTALSSQQIASMYGLVGYWKFDDGSGTAAIDSSGSNNTGTLIGSPTWTTGKIGGALAFSTNQYVSVPNTTISPAIVSTGQATGTAWVYATSAATSGTIIKSWPQDSSNDQFYFGFNGTTGHLSVQVEQSDGTVIGPVIDPNPLPLNAWEFVAFTADGSTLKLYINGTVVASTSYDGTLHAGGNYIGIGAELNDSGSPSPTPGYFDGTLDDVHLYNRGLSSDQIQSLMETLPSQVTNVQGAGNYNSGFSLTWNANPTNDNVTDYYVQYVPVGQTSWTTVDTVSTTPSYTLSGIPPGNYQFRVIAVNALGQGEPSSSISIDSPVQSYTISDCAALEDIANIPGDAYGNYSLTNNIDCSGIPNFVPINFSGNGFQGVFNGQGYTISNLNTDTTQGSGYGGLFENVAGATLENIAFDQGTIAGSYQVGALASYAYDTAISNVTSDLTVSGPNGGDYVGGLVGEMDFSTLSNASDSGSISGGYAVGGLIGGSSESTISSSSTTGAVNGEYYAAGGLVGYASDLTVTDSFATGAITGDQSVGGLVGDAYDSGGLSMNTSFASGAVSGGVDVGGLVGALGPGGTLGASITNAYASGAISENQNVSDSFTDFGGLVGYATDAQIATSYYAGSVQGVSNIGGIIGESLESSITDSFSAANVLSDTAPSGAILGTDDSAGGYNGTDPLFTNVVYDASQSPLCDGTYGGAAPDCTPVNADGLDPTYFFNTTSVAPFSNGNPVWDFQSVWVKHTSSYPTFINPADPNASIEILSVTSTPSTTGATITWTTSSPGSSQVLYSLDTSYSSSTAVTDTSPRVTNHSVSLTSLTACTPYNFEVTSIDAASHTTTSTAQTFTTTGCATPPQNYTLTYAAGANGSVTGTLVQTVASGTNGTAVTAVPNNGYAFVNWTGTQTTTQNPLINTTVTEDMTETAHFSLIPLTSGGTSGGELAVVTPSTPTQILGSGICPASLIITDNMRVGDKDGTYDSYNAKTVTQVDILQKQINRILAASYTQAAGPTDGIFGPLTKQGVERLQRTLNSVLAPNPPLVIDGIVGTFTKKAMNNSCGNI